MKFGLFVDKTAQQSFEVRDKHSYKLYTDIPYTTTHSIENKTHMSIFQYPFLFNNSGYLVNMGEIGLPDIDFDIIFLVVERLFDQFPISKIRNKYPNAKIFGVLKEQYIPDERGRCKFLSGCDEVILPFKHKFLHYFFEKNTGKTPIWIPQPYDVDLLYNKFYKQERSYDIFSYISSTKPELRRAQTEQFTSYIANKYDLSVKRVSTNTWNEFMEEISSCKFLFNLDPIQAAGQTGVQTAILGVIGIGANSDSNYHLFPNSNGTNFDNLEDIFYKLYNDKDEYVKYIQQAFSKVNEIYGMQSVKQRILNLYNER